ncbi:hypothetical protein [Streptomyces acidiscabies]|uniref:Uncharacterized protein n=4 Tax=Streptomyces acidiscabies TaxID=42234 RepID=A0AAP6B6F4_9ACTN|nr:hypothetical protein [Streptomyces acidiscabies]MBP5940432.1 hypothetical protein [Streptomyces sp. LBUM 1476]MBZ3911673.1 hypothetical protein [Streptomyces acidiscabies]MDX2958898.1 hypothetical protein [Streptomyces acidiscabies]MDX3018335.1 hypothetical protein [Streptomyces acidiscabies]MDX3794712.1 hypothetical protein [Streptomyces acidiscabies]
MTMRRDVHDDLRARLHEATEQHEPDRARILARVERGMMAAPDPQSHRSTRPVLGWARIVGATAAVAGMLAVGGYAVASVVKSEPPAEQTVAVSPTPTASPDATSRPPNSPSPSPSSKGGAPKSTDPGPSRTAGASPSPQVGTLPPAAGTSDGPLSSDGSIDAHSNEFWAQSDVTVKASKELTALTVQLKVAQTGGVTNTGAWRALPEDDFAFTVGEKDGFLVYTWVLKDGRTVPSGEWVFAGQYNHDRGGRDARGDTYVVGGTAEGKAWSVGGGFAAVDSDKSAKSGS